jgi:hypothetical protein
MVSRWHAGRLGRSIARTRAAPYAISVGITKVEVTYRDKTVKALSREADKEEWEAIWARARMIYPGYDAYARRIKNRQVHIMILGTGELQ